MNKQKIMIIPGGKFQIPLVKKAKEMGLFVIVTDMATDAPCKKYADIFEVVSVFDIKKNLKIAQTYNVDAILTDQTDIAVKTVAYLNSKMNLNGIGLDKASLFTNKYKMREFCRKNGFNYPKFKLCFHCKEAEKFINQAYPIVIKPIDSQSSKGVFLIHNKDELYQKFEISKMYSHSKNAVLVEEFLCGQEFTVDGIKTPDGYATLAISQKIQYNSNIAVSKCLVFKHTDDYYDYNMLRHENKQLIMAMNLPFGLTHAEYIYVNNKFYLVEIAARGGGTYISSCIVPKISGVDNYKSLISMGLGNSVTEKEISVSAKFSPQTILLEFFDFETGKISDIKGLSTIKNMKGVMFIYTNVDKGSVISSVTDDTARSGYFILRADSEKELKSKKKQIFEMLEVSYE